MITEIEKRSQVAIRAIERGEATVLEALDSISSGLSAMLQSDLADRRLNALWGYCRGDSVSSKVLETFAAISGNAFLASRAPSGIIHTYGYLLSDEGGRAERSKRFRWTSGGISRFFECPDFLLRSGNNSFLSGFTEALLSLTDSSRGQSQRIGLGQSATEIARFDESCEDADWHSRWRVFQNPDSAFRELDPDTEGHLLVYQLGRSLETHRFITAFPVRYSRIEVLVRQQRLDRSALRFNAVTPD